MVNEPTAETMPRIGTTWFQSLEYCNVGGERPQLIIEFQ
jgi:hypothetical protein